MPYKKTNRAEMPNKFNDLKISFCEKLLLTKKYNIKKQITERKLSDETHGQPQKLPNTDTEKIVDNK